MQHSRTSQRTALMLARIAAAIIALLLAHDTVMALDPHTDAETTHHGDIVVQECGPSDGILQIAQMLPGLHPSGAIVPTTRFALIDSAADESGAPILPAADASQLRAVLQIFLN